VLTGDEISIGGSATAKLITGKYFSIGRRGEVQGIVSAETIIISSRATAQDLYGKEIRIEENARIKNIYGDDISIEEGARVSGEILYTNDIYIEEGARISNEPKKVKTLPEPKAYD